MGQLVDGKWQQTDVRQGEKNDKGEFLRKPVSFRNQIETGGDHPPEVNRYHLYVSYACPWAHRTLIMRGLKSLEKIISVSVVSPWMLDDGWSFNKDYDHLPEDPINQSHFLREVYLKADRQFTGRVTVPVLWDKKLNTIVNNESSEIIRIFNSQFNHISENRDDFIPSSKLNEIEKWNELIYPNINNGVYRCGFATSQKAYEEAFGQLFSALEKVDQQLKDTQYLCGEQMTEADIRLFPTLIRFDAVYHTHFKCNGRLIQQYKGLSRFVDDMMSKPEISETVNMDHIKQHYFYSHKSINPSQIVPLGPIENSKYL